MSSEQGRTVRLALMKAVPVPWDLERNWQTMSALWQQAAEAGADMFVTPECFLDGYAVAEKDWGAERFTLIAQDRASSPYLAEVRELARRYRMHTLFCYTERRGAEYYNTALLLDDQGEPTGQYDKTHLLDHDTRFAPGAALDVFATRLGRVGVVICADRRWPETVRVLRVRGAELVLVPAYGMCHEANEWWMRTRAYENEVHLAFCHPNLAFICDPRGNVPAKLQSNVPGVLIADIDLSANLSTMLEHRRPELYTSLSESDSGRG